MSNLPMPLAHRTREAVLCRHQGYVNSVGCDPLEKKPFFHTLPGATYGLENACPPEYGSRLIEGSSHSFEGGSNDHG